MGDPLEKVAVSVDFEIFRPLLNEVYQKEAATPGGRPPWDYVLMFKILLLQQWYNIADDRKAERTRNCLNCLRVEWKTKE